MKLNLGIEETFIYVFVCTQFCGGLVHKNHFLPKNEAIDALPATGFAGALPPLEGFFLAGPDAEVENEDEEEEPVAVPEELDEAVVREGFRGRA